MGPVSKLLERRWGYHRHLLLAAQVLVQAPFLVKWRRPLHVTPQEVGTRQTARPRTPKEVIVTAKWVCTLALAVAARTHGLNIGMVNM
jgi:hypothetical protein